MTVLAYLLICLSAIGLSKMEQRINLAVASASIALPFALFSALGLTIALVALIKTSILAIIIILLILSKLKILIGAKLVAICVSASAALLGFVTGPLGPLLWIISIFVLFILLKNIMKSTFQTLYIKFISTFSRMLMWVRTHSDLARSYLPQKWKPLVLLAEIPIVCGSSAYSIWAMMDWFDKNLSPSLIMLRIVILLPFVLEMYKSYWRDTTPPNSGQNGLEIPLPLQFGNFLD